MNSVAEADTFSLNALLAQSYFSKGIWEQDRQQCVLCTGMLDVCHDNTSLDLRIFNKYIKYLKCWIFSTSLSYPKMSPLHVT